MNDVDVVPHDTVEYGGESVYHVEVCAPHPDNGRGVGRYTLAAETPWDALEIGMARFEHPAGIRLAEVSSIAPDNRGNGESKAVARYLSGTAATETYVEEQVPGVARKSGGMMRMGATLDIDWEHGEDTVLAHTVEGETVEVEQQGERFQVKGPDDTWQDIITQ